MLLASNLMAARQQMAFTLGVHIILVPFGVAFPFITLIANYRAVRHDDPDALRLARRRLRERAMKATDLRPKTNDQLKDELGNLRKEAFNLRFQKAGGQLQKTARARQVRRDIARIKTVLGEKAAG